MPESTLVSTFPFASIPSWFPLVKILAIAPLPNARVFRPVLTPSDEVCLATSQQVDTLYSPILDFAFSVAPGTKRLRSGFLENRLETEIYMQEIH